MKNKLPCIVILGLILFSSIFLIAGLGKILNLVFPVATFSIGILFYYRYPILYVGFTWWMWFLTPLIRRLVDYRIGFTDPSPVLLAPYLTTLVSLITLWKFLPKVYNQQSLPFILSFLGILYGFFVGLIYRPPIQVFISLLDWLAPISFGFHLFLKWSRYPDFRNVFERAFFWGVIVMGIYGVAQYIIAPDWDRYWLLNAEIVSAGIPEPLGIRVWSTMNSPGSFAIVMMSGLLLLFGSKGYTSVFATLPGYLSFLLSSVRSAWGGWFIALITLTIFVKSYIQIRMIIILIFISAIILPLATIEPFSPIISERIETFSNIRNDGSAQARQETYEQLLGEAITNIFGKGIGSPKYDSGILAMLFSLGWIGTLLYMGGLILLLYSFLNASYQPDVFLYIIRAIIFGVLAQFVLAAVFIGVGGVIIWGFLGLGLASHQYNRYIKINKSVFLES